VFEVLEECEDVVLIRFRTQAGTVEVIAKQEVQGRELVLRGLHIDGPGRGTIGHGTLLRLAREYGRWRNVDTIYIEGSRRTSGRIIGRLPRPLRIEVN
jgi:hypothetical protein